jgi:very-short-patch-repair endonuclease
MPLKRTDKTGYARALALRKEPSLAERRLWKHLQLGQFKDIHFRKQHAIGPFVIDFCAIKEKLVIEVDGGQHIDQEIHDNERSEFLKSKGYKVIRFWNNEVMNDIEGVMRSIEDEIKNDDPLLPPPNEP